MPISDFDCVQVCAQTYWSPESLSSTLDVSGVFVGIQKMPDATIICFRGSTTFLDWVRDFEYAAQMITDPELGDVHPGFLEGMRDVLDILSPDPDKPTIITGHSLGAGRAWIYAALLAEHNTIMEGDRICVFGSPLPGAQKLSDILSPYPKISYKNRHDLVSDVPFDIPIIDPYVKPCNDTRVNIKPPVDDLWGIFKDHHCQLYWQALSNGQAMPSWMPSL